VAGEMTSTDTNLVVLGAVGALTFSLLFTKTLQYLVGIGFFAIAFLLVYAVINDLNAGMIAGLLLGLFAANFFKWVLVEKNDVYSAIFLVVVAIVGILLLFVLLLYFRPFSIEIPAYRLKVLPRPNESFWKLHQAMKGM